MSTTYDWSQLFGPLQQAIQQYGDRNQYQDAVRGMFGSPLDNVQVTPQVSAANPINSAPRQAMNAANAQNFQPGMFGSSAPQGMSQMMAALPPSIGMQMLPQLALSQMNRQQNIADKQKHLLTPDELAKAGYRPGTVVEADPFNNQSVVQASDMKSAGALGQELDTKKQEGELPLTTAQKAVRDQGAAELAEKKREYDASNPMLSQGGGAGPASLETYPPAVQATVKSMLEGRMAPPSSFALSKPYWQNMMAIANTTDPSFDQTTWGARASARKDFMGGGKSYTTLNSGNTAIQHLGHLNDQIDNVSGVAVPLIGDTINAGINKWNAPKGNLNPYLDTQGHLSEELTKFYRGTGGNEADIERSMANMSPDLSTQAKKNGIKNTVSLVYGKLAPMVEQYNKTMGTNYPASHFLSTQAVTTIKRMGFDPDTGEAVAPVRAPASPSSNASAPSGVDPNVWQHMTPQEKALWRN